MLPLLPVASALFCGASGLRFFAERPAAAVALDHWTGGGEEGFNPPIKLYRDIWHYRYGLESRLQEPMSKHVRLVLGVMSVPQDVEYRRVVRETWLRQRGVCLWSRLPQEGCSVYVAFVIGNSGTGRRGPPMAMWAQKRAREEPGMFVLPMEENMDDGKTMVWFREALKAFPWATHYGKTDIDTYVFLHKLVHRLAQNRTCVDEASDFEFVGRPHNACPHPWGCATFTQACPDSRGCFGEYVNPYFEKYGVPSQGAFYFLLGEFYAMSAGLASAVDWEPRHGKEDEETSISVNATAFRLGKCVAIRRFDVAVHAKRPVPGGFANDF